MKIKIIKFLFLFLCLLTSLCSPDKSVIDIESTCLKFKENEKMYDELACFIKSNQDSIYAILINNDEIIISSNKYVDSIIGKLIPEISIEQEFEPLKKYIHFMINNRLISVHNYLDTLCLFDIKCKSNCFELHYNYNGTNNVSDCYSKDVLLIDSNWICYTKNCEYGW